MKLMLTKKPKNPIIIDGFTGFGLVGTIAAEFLLDHLKTKKIGRIWMDELPAMVAIHQGHPVEPIGIFYNEKYNIVIVHAVTAVNGVEWKITDAIMDMARDMKAKEIISLEGIGSTKPSKKPAAFYSSTNKAIARKWEQAGVKQLKEGIVMGTTGILLLKAEKNIPVSTIFAETHSQLPDSKAAAMVITLLDKYIGLAINPKPLLKQAEQFEGKLKSLLDQGAKLTKEQQKKKPTYFG